MAYNNYQQRQPSYPPQKPITRIQAEKIPDDYVKAAETAVNSLQEGLSNSKLRNLFQLFVDTYNSVKLSRSDTLNAEQARELEIAKVRIIYECGRAGESKDFTEKAKLLQYLYSVGSSKETFINFYHYFEAVVAFHYYRFGIVRDKQR